MGFNKNKKEKKKGPKGKKARAKAKLERQWGEVVDASGESQLRRRGKSRLLHQQGRDKKRAQEVESNSHSKSDNKKDEMDIDTSSDESGREDEVVGGALNLLLESIQKKSRGSRQVPSRHDNEDSSGSADERDSEISEGQNADGESVVEDGELSMSDDEMDSYVENDNEGSSLTDPFSSHFGREPLSETELVDEAPKKSVKLSFPVLDSCLEFTVNDAATIQGALPLFACNRKMLQQTWKKVNASAIQSSKKKVILSPLQSAIYPSLATYKDILIAAESPENRLELTNVYALHVLNHVLTSRGRIRRNNKKLQQEDDEDTEYRDQGFTRPTVLVLLPTRGTCHLFVQKLLALLGNGESSRVDNADRFDQEFGPPEVDDEPGDEKRQRQKQVMRAKGSEWQELFGEETNDDDDFKIGMSLAPKTTGGVSVKLYSDFYMSDIILASPLGMKLALDKSNDEEEEDAQDVDFLSSIEVCLVARSSVLLMQNWDHLDFVIDCLNRQPKKNNDTDFGRVRNYLLAGQGMHWRQLIISSSLIDAQIVSTFKRNSKSLAGRLKLRRRTPVEDSSLCNVLVRVKQVFQRIQCTSFASQGKDRLRYFEQRILPQIRKQKQTMIFIPSYFDFISVRNLLLKKEIEFVSVTEYARVSEVTRGRARFLQGIKPLMLYTGRAHFFQRHVIKGVRHLVLYGLPEHAEFYSGLVNDLNAGLEHERGNDDLDMAAPLSCISLFVKYDALALERIVGKEHCDRMIKGDRSTYMFSS